MEDTPKELNPVDKSAADVLLDAVSLVGGNDIKVLILIQDEEQRCFHVRCNVYPKDAHWMLSQALHTVIEDNFS